MRYDVAIVGAGLAGTLAAVQLALRAPELRVCLIEKGPAFGRGLAFGTGLRSHRLNLPAGRMSAFPNDSGHFLRWLRTRDPDTTAHDFVPRQVFGTYLCQLLDEARERQGPSLELHNSEVVGLSRRADALALQCCGGHELLASSVILALGNFAPAHPEVLDGSRFSGPRWHADPWGHLALPRIGPRDSVLLVGTGLTMIDMVLSLRDGGHRGTIDAISRHGYLPQVHRIEHPWTLTGLPRVRPTVLNYFRWLQNELTYAATESIGWRSVLDAFRPHTQVLWARLPLEERRRFLRHGKALWESHRHRIAPEIGEAIDRLLAAGVLHVDAARLVHVAGTPTSVEVVLRRRGTRELLDRRYDHVINCTGPNTDVRQERSAFVRSLLRGAYVVPDPLGLGIRTAPDGAVLLASGTPSRRIFTLGILRRGELWETTASPEIAQQAAALAERLASSLAHGNAATL